MLLEYYLAGLRFIEANKGYKDFNLKQPKTQLLHLIFNFTLKQILLNLYHKNNLQWKPCVDLFGMKSDITGK